MISSKIYTGDGTTKVFPVSFNIAGENYVQVWLDDVAVNNRATYDIINNSIVFLDDHIPVNGVEIEITVATTAQEIADLNIPPSGVVVVSSNIDDVINVASIISDVTTVAGIDSDVTTICTNIDNVNAVGTDIDNVNTTAIDIDNVNIIGNDLANSWEYTEDNGSINNPVEGGTGTSIINTVANDSVAINEIYNNRVEIYAADENANIATAKASEASTSADNASTAETNASNSADNASTAETNASNSADNSAISETNAFNSASNSANSATNSANSASNSATSETNALNYKDLALSYKNQAETAKDQALDALDSFDDRYLGQKDSDPTVDNDGDALVAGALYFNTVDASMKVYEGSAWVSAYTSLSGALLQANNLNDISDTNAARSNLGVEIGVDVQGYDANTVFDVSYVHTDNNYTTTEKNKLSGIDNNANNYIHPTSHTTSEISDFNTEIGIAVQTLHDAGDLDCGSIV